MKLALHIAAAANLAMSLWFWYRDDEPRCFAYMHSGLMFGIWSEVA